MENIPSANTTTEPNWPELRQERRAIVVVDVVESVRIMQVDEAGVIDRWRRYVNEVRTKVLPAHGGRLVKSLGDGMLLEFESVQSAVAAALDMQQRIPAYNGQASVDQALLLRMGVHVSQVVIDELDVYGTGVNFASRLASLAVPGGIVVSSDVREQAIEGLDAQFEDLGEVYLKHFSEPVHAIRVIGPGESRSLLDQVAASRGVQGEPRVAVMPLQGEGTGEYADVLGDLVADGIIAHLTTSGSLRVISRLSSSALSRRRHTLREVCALLGCDYLVSGRWVRDGSTLLCSVELADGATEASIWATRVRTSAQELLQPNDPVTRSVAEECVLKIVEDQLGKAVNRPLPSLHAYSLQLLGMALMHRSPRRDFDRSGEVLHHLVDRHPRSAQPRSWLAQWHVLRVTRGIATDLHAEGVLALEQTRRALEVDAENTLALAMEGFVQCHIKKDLDAAGQRLNLALEIRPSEPLAWLFQCVVSGFRGEGERAWEAAERAMSLSPLDPMRHYYYALASSAACAAGKFDRAVELADRSLRVNRDHLPTLRALTVALVETSDLTRAMMSAKRVLELDPEFSIRSYLQKAPKGAEATRERYAVAFARAGIPAR